MLIFRSSKPQDPSPETKDRIWDKFIRDGYATDKFGSVMPFILNRCVLNKVPFDLSHHADGTYFVITAYEDKKS